MVPGTPPYLSIFFCASLYVLGFTPSYSRIQTKYRRNTSISYVSLFFSCFHGGFSYFILMVFFSCCLFFSSICADDHGQISTTGNDKER